MRRVFATVVALAVVASVVSAQDASTKVAGGGIKIAGWQAKIDNTGENTGLTVNDAKFETMGSGMHVTTGPAITYYNTANTASGNYTVKATFAEPKFQGLNNHPHPYGIVIGGNDLGTDNASLLYCSAYGNGTFIMRGFGPAAFQLGGRRPTAHAAVKKVNVGEAVTQEVAIMVTADKVACVINGQEVASYPKSEVVGTGKLKSTDGVYGLRFGHNTEAHVSGFAMTKQ